MASARNVTIAAMVPAFIPIIIPWLGGQLTRGQDIQPVFESSFIDFPGIVQPFPYTDVTFDGWAHVVLQPYLASIPMIVAYLSCSACLVTCLVALFRWRYMGLAGLLGLGGGLLWIFEIDAIPSSVTTQLCNWRGYVGQQVSCTGPAVTVGPGPYFMILAGAILIAGFVLARRGTLELPVPL
jgi:hypothetical protein